MTKGSGDVVIIVRALTKAGKRAARKLAGEAAAALSNLGVVQVTLEGVWPPTAGDGREAVRDRFRDLALLADDGVEVVVRAEGY